MKAIRSYLLRPTIPVVMIRKRISEDTALSIRRHLTDKALGKAKAIAIVVDSRGGDLPQT
jgi:ATP-dependent protease ClpP protease subunit